MKSRWLRRMGGALLILSLFVLPHSALAGGVSVSLDAAPADLKAGVAFKVGFTVRSLHDDSVVMGDLTPVLLLSNAATGEDIQVTAAAEGAIGHYAAQITLPSAGTWSWQIRPFGGMDGDYSLVLAGPLHVRGADEAPAPPNSARGPVVDVKAIDSAFDPVELKVTAGTTVVWHNAGALPHAVSADNGSFASGNLAVNAEFAHTFSEPGTYYYFCDYHGQRRSTGVEGGFVRASTAYGGGGHGMQGVVIVAAAPAAVAPQPAALPAAAPASASTAEAGRFPTVPVVAGVIGLLGVAGLLALRTRRRAI
jgi:plastocyanin